MPPSPTPTNPTLLTEYPYRPRKLPTLLSALFFTLCGIVLTLNATNAPSLLTWAIATLAWAFVALAIIALAAGALRPQRIALTPTSLILPRSRWSTHEREVPLTDILHTSLLQVAGQRFLRLHLPDEELTLNAAMLPDAAAFHAIEAHLNASGFASDLPLEAPSEPGPRHLSPWHLLAIKLLALFSFCGAPLYLTDLTEPSLGDPGAFIANFTPLALMLFGTLSLAEDELSGISLLAVRAGALGAILLATQTLFTVAHLLAGNPHPNTGLITFGMMISALAIGGYLWMWRRRCRARPTH